MFMKYLLSTIAFMLCQKDILAQRLPIPVPNGEIQTIKIVPPYSFPKNFADAKYLFSTDKGKVYALPLDNMPCLVPYQFGNMPNATADIENIIKIPNAYPQKKLIPESNDFTGNNKEK